MSILLYHKRLLWVGIGCIVLLSLLAVCPWYIQYRYDQKLAREHATISVIAHHLHLGDTEEITKYMCWSMARRCGNYGVYETPLSVNDLQSELVALGWGNWSQEMGSWGVDIFGYMNGPAGQTLTANGQTNITAIQIPDYRQYSIRDHDGQLIEVTMYGIQGTPEVYELNGQPMTGNILTIRVYER